MLSAHISGIGAYLPLRRVHNSDLPQSLDTSDEWIVSHTGISYRHLAEDHESTASMGVAAAQEAIKMSGLDPKDIGLILLSSTTLDYAPIPATGCLIQEAIGAKNAVAIDISSACCGFVYGIQLAKGFMQLDSRPALVIGSELMSRRLDWTDKKTCVLFGDAAGAAILTPNQDAARGLIDTYMQSDGQNALCLIIEGGCREPIKTQPSGPHYLQMEGKTVYKFATKIIPEIVTTLLRRNSLNIDEIDWILPHQANLRIINSAANRLGIPMERFYVNLQDVANTASASIPLALSQMNAQGLLKPGAKILTAGFGAGLTYGGNYIVW